MGCLMDVDYFILLHVSTFMDDLITYHIAMDISTSINDLHIRIRVKGAQKPLSFRVFPKIQVS